MRIHVCAWDTECDRLRHDLGTSGPPPDRVHLWLFGWELILAPISKIQRFDFTRWRYRDVSDEAAWRTWAIHPPYASIPRGKRRAQHPR